MNKACSIAECETPSRTRGWCAKHYKRFRAHGDPLATVRTYTRGPQECSTAGCANPKSDKASQGRCSTCFWRGYREVRRAELDANYKAWREAKGSRWASMPEPEREQYRANAAKRRAARKGDMPYEVSARDIEKQRIRQGRRCAYCHARDTSQIDHVMPLAAGGRHSIGNLVLACGPCNKSKGSATVTEWRHALRTGKPIRKRLYRNGVALIDGQELAA